MGNCEQCIVKEMNSFRALRKEDLIHLVNCKKSYSVKKGETVFKEGDPINGVYCIKDGLCKVMKMNAQGKDTILKLVTKGELLGQRSVFVDEYSNLTAMALEDMQVCFIPKSDLMHFYENNAKFSLEITKDICQQLKTANEYSINHTHKTVKQRLAIALIDIKNRGGLDETGYLRIQLSRDEIAGIVGTATESCIRLLSELKKEDIISISGKKIKIENIQALKNLAEL